jgi:CheY-like chemotaxis protein
MSRILLADDSPHAQRMGEFILREEGYEVVTVTDGETALVRLADVDPDLILADVLLPQKSGYEICRHVKDHPRFRHTRVVLTAGALEPFDEEEARRVQADANLRKPFEATLLLATVKPLLEAAELARKSAARAEEPALPETAAQPAAQTLTPAVAELAPAAPELPPIDAERVRAAITLALDAALPAIIDEMTGRVLAAFEKS